MYYMTPFSIYNILSDLEETENIHVQLSIKVTMLRFHSDMKASCDLHIDYFHPNKHSRDLLQQRPAIKSAS